MTMSALERAHDLPVEGAFQVVAVTLPCRVNDPELWFAETPSDVELAKALCVECPMRALCLDGAIERREPWGVWGGQLFLQGVVVPRKRPRGRPRRNRRARVALATFTRRA
jgi:WhiB family transcriptional regulator, redox-sensing transcriptional regulator